MHPPFFTDSWIHLKRPLWRSLHQPQALYLLLMTFATSGLCLAMSRSAAHIILSNLYTLIALIVGFYGANAAGFALMAQTQDQPLSPRQALSQSLCQAHRLLLVLAWFVMWALLPMGLLSLWFWLSQATLIGAALGSVMFALGIPLGVLTLTLLFIAVWGVLIPVAIPAIWARYSVKKTIHLIYQLLRHRLSEMALLVLGVNVIVSLVTGGISLIMIGAAKIIALGATVLTQVDIPLSQLMAGLGGYGLRSFSAAGIAVGASNDPTTVSYTAAGLIGMGVVFALLLVLPTLIYMQACCTIFLKTADETVPSN